jgi:hypothetical protein
LDSIHKLRMTIRNIILKIVKDNLEQIREFVNSIPEKFHISEQGVKIEIQEEYIEYSDSFDVGALTDEQIEKISQTIFSTETTDKVKKKGLTILAHAGSINAYNLINEYYQKADGELKQWASLALQECKMFLESELLDENIGFISTGLGGKMNKLRVYFLVLPLEGKAFNEKQHRIIDKEFTTTAKGLNCEIETFNFQDRYVGFTVLIPIDVAIATFIETGIQDCNEFGNFVFEHYYAANTEIPDEEEIEEIIEIVRN